MVAQIDPPTGPTNNNTLITTVETMREENQDKVHRNHYDDEDYVDNEDEELQDMEMSPAVSPINDENNHNDEEIFSNLLPSKQLEDEKFTNGSGVKLPHLIELHNIIHEIKERTKRYGGGVDNEEQDGMKLSLKFCKDFIRLRSLSRRACQERALTKLASHEAKQLLEQKTLKLLQILTQKVQLQNELKKKDNQSLNKKEEDELINELKDKIKKRSELEERINEKQSSIRKVESMISKYVKDIEVLQDRL
ncbi:14831_t:CDS:1 [Funneliformis caledonium]|uniref:14831_t:CDS:1 n=1 Tax=Funneliformis caledonium TaxID=1117310 RepID=A0A9N8Z1F3_9GLOM|nr:14831_t:CDS:1 [Funneliformis caledonium]